MSANHGSVEMARSYSSGKLSLMGSSSESAFGTREMVCNYILKTLFISNFEIKFLKEEDPTNELGLRILF